MTDTEHPSISEVQPTRHLTASADYILYPDQETLLCVRSAQIRDGDVMIVPSPRFMSKGVVIATCLVRFTDGSATPSATKATSEQIRLPESANVFCCEWGSRVPSSPLLGIRCFTAFKFWTITDPTGGHYHHRPHRKGNTTPSSAPGKTQGLLWLLFQQTRTNIRRSASY